MSAAKKPAAEPVEPLIETLTPEDCVVIEHACRALLRRVMRLTGPDRDSVIADDAGWEEHLHPRDPDGKFSSTGGSGPGSYLASIGNKKPTIAGLMKHMLMTGLYSEKEIHDTANKHFAGKAQKQHVKWYQKELMASGKNPPPMLDYEPSAEQQKKLNAIGVKSGAAQIEPEEESLADFKLTPEQKQTVAAVLSEAKLPPHLAAAINKFEAKNNIPQHTIKTMEMEDIFPSMKKEPIVPEGYEMSIKLTPDQEKTLDNLAGAKVGSSSSTKAKAAGKMAPQPTWDIPFTNADVSIDSSTAYQEVKHAWYKVDNNAIKEKCVEKLDLIDKALEEGDGSIQDIVPFKTQNILGIAINSYLDSLQIDDTKKEMAKDKEGWKPESTPEPEAPKIKPLTDAAYKGEDLHDGEKLSETTKAHFANMKKYWPNTLGENLEAVQEKVGALNQALLEADQGDTTKLASLSLFGGSSQGAAKNAADNLVTQAQIDYGVDPQAAAKAAQKATQEKAKAETAAKAAKKAEAAKILNAAPHSTFKNTSILEDANGKDITAKDFFTTKNIPTFGDFNSFQEVTKAFKGVPTFENTNSEAVGTAMNKYMYHTTNARPDDEKMAVQSYKGSGYTQINDHLLKGNGTKTGSKSIIDKVKLVDKAIAESFVPANIPAYRGLRCTLEQLTGFSDPDHSIGRAFQHLNFASCSRDFNTSYSFGHETMLQLTIPAGTNGIVIGPQLHSENETVLPRNSIFRIDKVERDKHGPGKHHCHVTYMGVRDESEVDNTAGAA